MAPPPPNRSMNASLTGMYVTSATPSATATQVEISASLPSEQGNQSTEAVLLDAEMRSHDVETIEAKSSGSKSLVSAVAKTGQADGDATPKPLKKSPVATGTKTVVGKSRTKRVRNASGSAGPPQRRQAITAPKRILYSDLGGIEDVLSDIRELIEYPLKHPEVNALFLTASKRQLSSSHCQLPWSRMNEASRSMRCTSAWTQLSRPSSVQLPGQLVNPRDWSSFPFPCTLQIPPRGGSAL
jgi:hypothetical protein